MTPMINPSERRILLDVLSPFAEQITLVAVFGSRATGRARPNSDIDLVIHGDIDSKLERSLWTEFEDSNLPVRVDIISYAKLSQPALKTHIDNVALPLFTKQDLEAAIA